MRNSSRSSLRLVEADSDDVETLIVVLLVELHGSSGRSFLTGSAQLAQKVTSSALPRDFEESTVSLLSAWPLISNGLPTRSSRLRAPAAFFP